MTTALAGCFALSGCAGTTDYSATQSVSMSEWSSVGMNAAGASSRIIVAGDAGSQAEMAAVAHAWWRVFRDPVLDEIVGRALTNSQLMASAEADVKEAEANARAAGATLMPEISGVGSMARASSSDSAGGLDTVRRAGVQGTWDTDLAGVSKRRRAAALAALEVAQANRDRVRIDVVADVAVAYVRLRGAQSQQALANANVTAQQGTLKITQDQRGEGAVSDFEVARSESQVAATRARIWQFDTAVVAAINRINVLCGEVPGTLNGLLMPAKPIPALPVRAVVAQPAVVLAQRPDIRAAERGLVEAAELKRSASLEVFPTLSLSAFFGFQDSSLGGGFSPWNVAASAAAPILNFGRIQSRIDAASAREMAAFHNFRQTTISAVAEVEDAMTGYLNEQKRASQLEIAASRQARAVDIVEERFRLGEALQTDLLLSEEDRLEAELALAVSRTQAAENLINLYRAMGWGASAGTADMKIIQTKAMRPALKKQAMQPIVDQ